MYVYFYSYIYYKTIYHFIFSTRRDIALLERKETI